MPSSAASKNAPKKIITKTHTRAFGALKSTVVAMCDYDLLGKVFTQGEAVLDLKDYRSFYEGIVVSEERAMEIVKDAENASIVGERSVAIAQKALGFKRGHAKKIGGVPHLQIYKV